jgi:hypothetical protein
MITKHFAKLISHLLNTGYTIETNEFGAYVKDSEGNYPFRLTSEQMTHLKSEIYMHEKKHSQGSIFSKSDLS